MHYCDKFRESFSSYIEGEIAPDARQVLESHLSACPECRETIYRMRSLRHALNGLYRVSTSPEFEYRLNQRLRRTEKQMTAKFPMNYFGDWKIPAAGFALVVIVFTFFLFFEGEPTDVNISAPQRSIVAPGIQVEEPVSDNEIKKDETGEPASNMPPDSAKQNLQKELNDSMKLINKKTSDK